VGQWCSLVQLVLVRVSVGVSGFAARKKAAGTGQEHHRNTTGNTALRQRGEGAGSNAARLCICAPE
jgi:hypothetical protein